MKTGIWLTSLSVMALFATSLSIAGCKGLNLRTTISSSLQTVQDDLEYAQLQVKDTEDALNDLIVAPDADLRQAYETFSERVDKLTGTGARLVRHADGIYYRDRSYFVEPEASANECQYPRLSNRAGTRPVELGEAFDPLAERSLQVKRALREYDFDVTQIRDQLSAHLTPRSVEAMNFIIRKAQADGESLDYALVQALFALQSAKTAQMEAAPVGAARQ